MAPPRTPKPVNPVLPQQQQLSAYARELEALRAAKERRLELMQDHAKAVRRYLEVKGQPVLKQENAYP